MNDNQTPDPYKWLVCPICLTGHQNHNDEITKVSRLLCPADPEHGHMMVQADPPKTMRGKISKDESPIADLISQWLENWFAQIPNTPDPTQWRTAQELNDVLVKMANQEIWSWADAKRLALHLNAIQMLLYKHCGFQRAYISVVTPVNLKYRYRFGIFDEINKPPGEEEEEKP